tara:strand:+ start:396 stop:2432 length:2037 start_codon:yes stop_codon:yes gene_type:complete
MVGILGANSVSGGYEIDNSLRFNNDDSPKLTFTPSSAGNRRTFTLSVWFKLQAGTTGERVLLAADNGTGSDNNFDYIAINSSDKIFLYNYEGGEAYVFVSTQLLRDPSAWYHLVVAFDTTQGTDTNRVKIYLNGSQITAFDTANYPSQNVQTRFNNNNAQRISSYPDQDTSYFDGYMAEYHLVDGSAKAPTDFGETDDNGVWIPKAYDGSYGTNGFYLDFSNDATKHAIAVVGNAKHSTTQNKIGATSISFDGNGDRLDIPASTLMETVSGTIECWVYMNALADGSELYYNPPIYNKGNVYQALTVRANGKVTSHLYTGSVDELISANAISTGAWNHIAVTWNADGRKIWINGVLNGTSSTSLTAMDSGGNNATFHIGEGTSSSSTGLNAYVDELRVSKTVRYTSNFTPYTAALTEDSNTTLLIHSDTDNNSTTFSDSSGVIGGPGNDQSGNDNHWAVTNLAATDVTTDTPTNNFATMSPLASADGQTFSEGNTQVVLATGSTEWCVSTMAVANGKWYCELKPTSTTGMSLLPTISETDSTKLTQDGLFEVSDSVGMHLGNGNKYINGSASSYGTTLSDNDILGIAVNLDDDEVYFYKNGTVMNSGTAISKTFTAGKFYYIGAGSGTGSGGHTMQWNFGNAPFEISSGNADANGHGNFEYAVPSGYFALCTKNLGEFG